MIIPNVESNSLRDPLEKPRKKKKRIKIEKTRSKKFIGFSG